MSAMPRFVLLEHDHPELHWDFMLEDGPVLKTWRLAHPFGEPGQVIAATALGDHRIAYLDYEGPVSGNRGHVIRRLSGTYRMVEGDFGGDRIVMDLEGERLRASVVLGSNATGVWTLTVTG
jgi:hypothetical protein